MELTAEDHGLALIRRASDGRVHGRVHRLTDDGSRLLCREQVTGELVPPRGPHTVGLTEPTCRVCRARLAERG